MAEDHFLKIWAVYGRFKKKGLIIPTIIIRLLNLTSLSVKCKALLLLLLLFESLTFWSNQQPKLVKNVLCLSIYHGANESFGSIAISIVALSEALSMWLYVLP